MPEVKEYEPGTPSWIDLGSPDIEASSRFYGGVFGWTFESAGPVEETGGYGMFTLNGLNVAGLGPQMNMDQPPYWSMYVSVADIDATVPRRSTQRHHRRPADGGVHRRQDGRVRRLDRRVPVGLAAHRAHRGAAGERARRLHLVGVAHR